MATNDSIFPADTKDAESTYKQLLDRGKDLRAPHQCQWYYTQAYCQGARNFIMNYRKGTVTASFVDKKGRLKFVYEQLLTKYTNQKGRLMGMDLTPRVVRRNNSLNGQRAAATDQAVLSHLFPASRVNRAKRALMQPFLFYGTLGLSLWESPDDPKDMDLKLIMPWHITPIPTVVTHPEGASGMIVRKRMPIEEIKRKFRNMKFKEGAISTAERITVNRGDMPGDTGDDGAMAAGMNIDDFFSDYGSGDSQTAKGKTGSDKGKTDRMDIAWLGLVYLWDERKFMTEQLVFIGSRLLGRTSFTMTKTYRPVVSIHDIEVGGYYSRGWMELQIPMNGEIEGALGRTFQNVKNLDMYGQTMVPTNFGINRHAAFTAKDGGPKFQSYEWDAMTPGGQNIFQIKPFTSGNFAPMAVKLGVEISDRLANQPSALLSGDAPGRTDSAAAMGALMETSNIPISPSAVAIAEGFAEMYRAALCRAQRGFAVEDTIEVNMLEGTMIGLVYDPRSGTISLSDSGIAHPDEVEVTVASQAPVSKQQQKMELENEFEKGRIDATEFRIKARLMKLELPVGNGIEWENYIKARTENQLLFHNGKEVPEGSEEQVGVLFSREADMHEVHLRVHGELIASVEFSAAAAAVRKRILSHIQLHQTDGLGEIPEGMENIEDAAEGTMQFDQLQGRAQVPMGLMVG